VFNVSDAKARVALPLRRYGFTADKYSTRDVWEGKDRGKVIRAAGMLQPHGELSWWDAEFLYDWTLVAFDDASGGVVAGK
jgi:Alpha galactosidase C-terminal beta sandwich domain